VTRFVRSLWPQIGAIHFILSMCSRKLTSSANSRQIALNRQAICQPPRIAIDTGVFQLFGKKVVSPEVVWASWNERDTAFQHLKLTADFQVFDKTEEMDFCFAICEACRAGDLRAVQLQSIAREQAGAKDIHLDRHHGHLRLDYGVTYELFDFLDSIEESAELFRRMRIDPTGIAGPKYKIDTKYVNLIKHLNGKAHIKDLIHLIACDIGNIDVFLTIDQKLINAFSTYQNRKGVYQLDVKLMTPRALCSLLKMSPIKIPV
jgi:hypothetical protein